ncbi:MAG: GGDEF domain-containing protein [Candidatus Omnitrophica bacterium]|nr:GGDEF domain-containing protein [Candidatus Omnitrophota bacterium]
MHHYIMLIMIIAFVALVVYFAKAAVLQFEHQADHDVFKVKEAYAQIIREKDALFAEKARLQAEADGIFSLYELMREITKTFDEQEAFQAFKDHLFRQIHFDDCQLVEPFPDDIEDFPSFKGYQFFSLKAKKAVLGELAYKGIMDRDMGTFTVLANQFALALRRIRLYKEVEEMSVTDSLTRLYTRRYFSERFAEEFARAKLRKSPLSLLMLDVDSFKRVNDQYGHLTGDIVLREVGRIVGLQTREIDITGRFGGEEFCAIFPDTDKPGALLAAERIRAAVAEARIRAYDAVLNVSVSIGVATFPEDARQMDELLDKADWALYRAKKLGRNRVVAFSVYEEDKQG